jgi:hypothetical protein
LTVRESESIALPLFTQENESVLFESIPQVITLLHLSLCRMLTEAGHITVSAYSISPV